MLRKRVEIFRKFKFLKFRLTGKYFSEIQKDGHFDEKERKNRTTTNIVKNICTRKREKRSLLPWQSHTIRPIAERNSEEGGFIGEEIFRGTLPCHKLGEITTLSREEHGSRGLAPQRLSYVEGLQQTNFSATLMPQNFELTPVMFDILEYEKLERGKDQSISNGFNKELSLKTC